MGKNNKKILITGGAGFVGTNTAIGLKEKHPDFEIISLDNLKRRGSELNIERLRSKEIRFLQGDVRNYEDLLSVGDIDTIIECSAEPSVLAGYGESPRYLINTNLTGAFNCLELARERKADFVFISTSRVYPIDKVNQIDFIEDATRFSFSEEQDMRGLSARGIGEGFSKEGVRTLYGASKLAAELLLEEYIFAYGVKGVINRCGVIAGPWQMGKVDQGFVALWVAAHHYKNNLKYIGFNGEGKQVRDILHVQDVVDLIDREIEEINKVNGKIFNVGGGMNNSVSLNEMTSLCQNITGNTIDIGAEMDTRKGDIRVYITDNSKVHDSIGWEPKRTVNDIVSDTYKWISENDSALHSIFN